MSVLAPTSEQVTTKSEVSEPAEFFNEDLQPLADAGFLPDLVPILPCNAELSDNSQVPLSGRGKVPGRYLGQEGWCGFKAWSKHHASPADIAEWNDWATAGTGIIGRRAPAFDLDIDDELLARRLSDLLTSTLGKAPCRIGRPPRRLLVYRCAEPLAKVTLVLKRHGEEAGRIEFLGAKQQYVVAGLHPRTQEPYTWPGGHLAKWGFDKLTLIDKPKIEAALTGMEEMACAAGYTVERLGRVKGAAETLGQDVPEWLPTDAGNMGRARQAFKRHLKKFAEGIPEGTRDDAVYKCAAQIFDFIADPVTVARWMVQELWPLIEGDFSQAQFLKCIEQGRKSRQNKVGEYAAPDFVELEKHPEVAKLLAATPGVTPGDVEPAPAKPKKRSRFYPVDTAEMANAAPPRWMVHELIEEESTVLFIGETGSYKSFVALDIALAVAAGVETFGTMPVDPGPTFYAALEGLQGIKTRRRHAWCIARGIEGPPDFYALPAPTVTSPEDCKEFIDQIRMRCDARPDRRRPRLIVLETLNKIYDGLDENNNSSARAKGGKRMTSSGFCPS